MLQHSFIPYLLPHSLTPLVKRDSQNRKGPDFVQDKEADGYDEEEEESAVSSSEEVSHTSFSTSPLS